jgi:hypothetical protein
MGKDEPTQSRAGGFAHPIGAKEITLDRLLIALNP